VRFPFVKSKGKVYKRVHLTPFLQKTVILPRDKHPISRKNIDQNALKVLYRLHNHGYKAYLVGGSVRDLLIGKKPKDFDVGTDATPRDIKRLFANSMIIGKRFKIVHIRFKGNRIIEVTTFRKKSDEDLSRKGLPTLRDNTFGSPVEDAFRRDLTINGLFYNIADFTVIDHVGGIKDIEEGIVRVIGNPEDRFIEDPVRMTRAIRHSARTGFTIEEETDRAIRKMSKNIALCPPPRMQEEILKDLRSGYSSEAFRLFKEYGIMKVLFPDICRSIENTEITEDMVLTALNLLDNLVKSGVEPSVPFLLAVPMIPTTMTYIDRTVSRSNGNRIDIPSLIQKHLFKSLRTLEISRNNIDIMKHLLYLNWKMLRNLNKNYIPAYLMKKNHFQKAFNLLGISARVFGYYSDQPYPSRGKNSDPLKKLIRQPHRRSRRKGRPKSRNGYHQSDTDSR
jgi:poly(A) polymerase